MERHCIYMEMRYNGKTVAKKNKRKREKHGVGQVEERRPI